MGTIKTTNIETITGSGTLTLGQSGETITVPSGVTVNMSSATQTGVGGTNTPYFYGELASNQSSVPRSTQTKITGMTRNEVDSDTAFDGTTFTVPSGQAGKYYLEGVLTASYGGVGQDGEQTISSIYKNGSFLKQGIIRQSSSSGQNMRAVTAVASGIFDLSVGDTIELYAWIQDASGDNGDAAEHKTSLGGYKIIE